jgi:ribosomal protein L11 methyltransferase
VAGNRIFLMMNDKQKIWYSIEIEARTEAEEAVEFALNGLDALGTEVNNLGKKQTETVTVIGYFNEKPDNEILQNELAESLRIYNFPADVVKKIDWREVENQDWLAEWKKHWKPTETEKFIIAPTWENVENTEKIIIRIEPSMAFGTGTHETTRLCLKAIEENYTGEMSFLDVGTGTGILAIAAKKLATERIENTEKENKIFSVNSVSSVANFLACDTDFDSIKIAKENAEMNDAADIEFYVGSISDETPEFDFVCANLTADVIVPILPLLIQKAKRILVLSGILREQEDLIASELKKFQIENFKTETDGEWISVSMENGKWKTENKRIS